MSTQSRARPAPTDAGSRGEPAPGDAPLPAPPGPLDTPPLAIPASDLSSRQFAAGMLAVTILAALLRGLFPTADPPWRAPVGIVWHDEGAWAHNARNRAVFGQWRLDEWNPMYVAPVYTALEYVAFSTLGVGLWQARVVPEVMGLASVLLLGLGVSRLANRRAGLIAAGLLATNFVYVMWNRVALLETTMTVWLVVAFYAYARARRAPAWGLLAGIAAWLAFFSKAAAAFFLPALCLVALWPLGTAIAGRARSVPASGERGDLWSDCTGSPDCRAGLFTLLGVILGAAIAWAVFVGPNWREYWFYNWQVSVVRKPGYSVRDFMDRITWLPILHDFFTRMWLVLVVAAVYAIGRVVRWTASSQGERLLLAWLAAGVLELIVHDVGNERRLVFLVPAMVAFTGIALGRAGRLLPVGLDRIRPSRAALAAPAIFYAFYVLLGAMTRLPTIHEIRPSVRASALAALLATSALYAWWRPAMRWLAHPLPARVGLTLAALVMVGDVAQFIQWAAGRTYRNYGAMRIVAERLPPGTLVHGKLANGLSLESRIRPVFVGRGFGNYEDRLGRDDIRYVLAYVSPRLGYDGPIIADVLRAYPRRRVLWTVPVAETTCDCDRAALFVKEP